MLYRRLNPMEKNIFINLYYFIKLDSRFKHWIPTIQHPKLLKLANKTKIFERNKQKKTIYGIVIFHFICISKKLNLDIKEHNELLIHEMVHVLQFYKKRNIIYICCQWLRKNKKVYKTPGYMEYHAEQIAASASEWLTELNKESKLYYY